jgi:hypothetical protein
MSHTTDAVANLPILRQRMIEAKEAMPMKFIVWRFKGEFICYTEQRTRVVNENTDFEILAEFDNKLETLEFIVSTMIRENGLVL